MYLTRYAILSIVCKFGSAFWVFTLGIVIGIGVY